MSRGRAERRAFERVGRSIRILVLISMASGCAIPGRLYVVAPAISGHVYGGAASETDVSEADVSRNGAQLALHVVHRVSADLYSRERVDLSADGNFAFEPVELAVAGHEYSKDYRVWLRLRVDGKERVIWRAEYSRLALAGAVALDCDLDRPVRHGQPCWVRNPLQVPWLIAEGERTYRRLCVRCHGIDGGGNAKTAEAPGGRPPPDLRAIAARRGGRFDRAEIAEWIEGRSSPDSHGPRRMPIWGERLSREFERYPDSQALVGATLDPLVTYLESLQRAD